MWILKTEFLSIEGGELVVRSETMFGRRLLKSVSKRRSPIGLAVLCSLVASAVVVPSMSKAADVVTIAVTSSQDVANGDTSSVSALMANPGPDGISLREAIVATNNSPGTYVIDFAPSLGGATIWLLSQLPPLSGGGVTINGDINGDGKPDVTLKNSATFTASGDCPSSSGCGLTIASSSNTVNGITLSGFGVGVNIDPLPISSSALATHETLSGNTVSNTDMQNIQQFGIIMGSMYLPGCGLYGGSAAPCTTDDTWNDTTITGNTIETLDTGFAIKDSDAGDTFSNTTVTKNVIGVQGSDSAISFEIGSNAKGSTVSGAVISHNTITGVTDEGIDVGPGTNRASGNSMTNIQILDNSVNLVSTDSGLCCQGIVVFAGTDAPSATDPNVLPLGYPDSNTLTNVLVQGNVVTGTLTSGILVVAGLGAGGSFNTISGVAIDENHVASTMEANGIAVTNGGGNPLGGRIATSNQISTVSIDANQISTGNVPLQPAGGYGAIDILGGGDPSKSNSISTVNLVNNVITSFNSAIVVIGGEDKDGMSSDNSVQGLRLVNDTVVSPGGNALDVSANANGNSSNVITGFDVINSILWGSIEGDVTASMLSHSLVEKTSWARQNGNVTGNPRFVNSTSGNYRLMPKSPARNKGTSSGAPTVDIVGHVRPRNDIDIGAYQSS
jgi:hypothetical protein